MNIYQQTIQLLIDDEVEAIKSYDKAIEHFKDDEEKVRKFEFLKKQEIEHKEILTKMLEPHENNTFEEINKRRMGR